LTITILPPEADPIKTLRTMAAFGMDEGRGIAEIKRGDITFTGVNAQPVIGLAILCKTPEKTPIPIYDVATRGVEVTMLADWLKARGFEASACRWNRNRIIGPPNSAAHRPAWELVTGPADVPAMPPEFPQGPAMSQIEVAMRQAELQRRINEMQMRVPPSYECERK